VLDGERDELRSVAHILTHDLRGPLNVALERSKLIDSDAEHAAEIKRALRRMSTLIEDAVFLSRSASVEDPRPVDLATCAEATRDALDVDIVFDTVYAPVVAGEESLLTQLFENLLRNTVEHGSTSPASQARQDAVEHGATTTDNSDAAPRVSVGRLDGGFYVADDGQGIPAEDCESVFEPGYASGTTGGTGLGLAIVERIVDAHGWSVSEHTDQSLHRPLAFPLQIYPWE